MDIAVVQQMFVQRFEEKAQEFKVDVKELCLGVTKDEEGKIQFNLYRNGVAVHENMALGVDIIKTHNPLTVQMVRTVLFLFFNYFKEKLIEQYGSCEDQEVIVEITLPKIEWAANYVCKISIDPEMKTNLDSKYPSRALAEARAKEIKNDSRVDGASVDFVQPPLLWLYKKGFRKEGRFVQDSELQIG